MLQQYGIKKREEKEAEERARQEELMGGPLGEAGINRAKKTPEELAAEAAAADQDEFTSKLFIHVITCAHSVYTALHCTHTHIQYLTEKPTHSSR